MFFKASFSQIILLILLIIAIPATIFLVKQPNQDPRNLATETPKKNRLILTLTLDPKTQNINIKEATAIEGAKYFPKEEDLPDKLKRIITPNIKDSFELIETSGQKTIQTKKINFSEYLISVWPVKGEKYGNSLVKLPEPMAVVQIDYNPGSNLTIRNITKKIKKTVPSTLINKAMANPKKVSIKDTKLIYNAGPKINTNNLNTVSYDDGYLDILYVASAYSSSGMGTFTNDVVLNKQFIFSLVPFSSYTSKIRIWQLNNTQDLGCTYNYGGIERCLYCNYSKVLAAAQSSGIAYDTIMVIHNSTKYGGCAMMGEMGVTHRGVSEYGTLAQHVAAHEFGHSFGHLLDEYVYDGFSGPVGAEAANCDDSSTCNKWRSYQNTCYRGCTSENAYRPSNNSLMYNGYPELDTVCQKALIPRIEAYVSNNSPTQIPTQIPPTDIPTKVPTVQPTDVPTQIPTKIPTITALPTKNPTIVPTATTTSNPLTPTPQLAICSIYDGLVADCDAHQSQCAYYFCSNKCRPRGLSNCDAGCYQFCK